MTGWLNAGVKVASDIAMAKSLVRVNLNNAANVTAEGMAAIVALKKKFVFMAFVMFLSVRSISEAFPGEGDRNCGGVFGGVVQLPFSPRGERECTAMHGW